MNQGNQNRPFRFEAFWLREPTLIGKIKEWWKGNENEIGGRNQMHTFQLRLKDLKGKIKKSNKEEFGLAEEEGLLIKKLEEGRQQEEIIWKQKSRVQWLKEGERNTRFFHEAMIQHKQQNIIFSLMDQQGSQLTQKEEMENLLVQNFKGLLTEPNIRRGDNINKIIQHIPNMVRRDQNLALLREISKAEVEEVIRNMARNKAPWPDRFIVKFFQVTWSFLSEDSEISGGV
eukprot:PITA_10926